MFEGLVGGWEVSSWANLSWSWVFSGMTLPSVGHLARLVVLSYTTERKWLSSRANFLISVRYLWMTLFLSEHQARIVTFNLFLKTWKKYKEKGRAKKKEQQEYGLGKSASQTKVPHTLYKGTHKWDNAIPCMSWKSSTYEVWIPFHLIIHYITLKGRPWEHPLLESFSLPNRTFITPLP
jgi:hypothetical protein